MNQPRNLTLVVSALIASLGPLVGNGLYAVPGSDGTDILEEYQDGLSAVGYVGFTFELIGFAAMVVFFGWLAVRTYAASPVAAATTAIAGSAMLAVKVGSAAPWMYVIANADDLDPDIAEMLIGLTDMAFVVSGFLFGIALAGAGVGLLRTDTARFLAWWPAVLGPLAIAAGIVGVTDPDAYVPIPFLLLLVWMIALAIGTAMRPGQVPSDDGANRAHSHAAATE